MKKDQIKQSQKQLGKQVYFLQLYSQSKPQMSHTKCQAKKSPNYEVKQRYIPTYVHQQIFQEAPLKTYSSRCTPTFHSTVFNTEGYNIKTVHSKNINAPVQVALPAEKATYTSQSKQKRVQDNFRQQKALNASKDNWFDHTKERIFSSIPNGQNRGYSRERKYVDLSSDPVFKDFTYENSSTVLRVADHPVAQCLKHKTQVFPVEIPQKVDANQAQQILAAESQTRPAVLEQVQVNKVSQENEGKKKRVSVREEKNEYNEVVNAKKQNDLASKDQNLKVKGRKPQSRPQTAQKARKMQERPKFTVVRKSRVHQN